MTFPSTTEHPETLFYEVRECTAVPSTCFGYGSTMRNFFFKKIIRTPLGNEHNFPNSFWALNFLINTSLELT